MTRSEEKFRDLLLTAKDEIEAGEWLYSKNENRLCRILDDPEARTHLHRVHEALRWLLCE